MDKNIIKKIIIEKQEAIVQTRLLERAIDLELHCNYVFVGMRRAGKSYLMMQHILTRIREGAMSMEDVLYINFEDEGLAIQAAYSLIEDSTIERATRALKKLAQAFPVQRALILTSNEEREIKKEGMNITVMPLWKWLLH